MKNILSVFIILVFFSGGVAWAQPANDDCTSATPLTVGAFCSFSTYTNTAATASGIANPGCANYLGGDVWFTVTVPASGHLIFDTQTGAGTITDVGMAIYSGNCGALTLIECDDDDSDNGTYMAKIDRIGLTPGSTVYIRVWEYGNNSFGNFDICVYEPAGTGPCASAVAISCGVDQTFTSSGVGFWNSGICGTGTPGEEKVYAFTPATTGAYILNISNTGGGDWMSYAYQEGSCSSTGWNCITRTDAIGNYGPISMTAGLTYYIMVDNENASAGNQHIFRLRCLETPGTYLHPTDGIQGTYNGACMVNTCTGTYVDDGNAGNYSNNVNSIYRTFCPDAPGKCMTATINSFNLESSAGCANDALIIRDGPTQGSAFLWGACGNWAASLPLTITSTNSSGCLTFAFYSNSITNNTGWNISLNCVDCGTTPTNNDCITAIPICGATNLNSASPGPGITSTCGGCNLSENFSNWYYFEITQSGKLALDLKPEDFFEDYDFALYKADDCASLGDPVRCSYAMSPRYCGVSSDKASYYINNVSFNTINNASTAYTNYYANYTTSTVTTVNKGSSYNLNVTFVGNNAEVTAWFDWDKSLTFDAGEYYTIGGTASNTTVTRSITIPATARAGKTAFRVYLNRGGPISTPCSSVANGEIEDYAIFIDDGTHCSNNVKDADEEGVDCGGVDCVPCTQNYWPTNTGMSSVASDFSEDVSGDSWVNWYSVNAGERYYLMTNNWSPGANGFDLVWQFSEGGAMDCDITLPVELLSFDAVCDNGMVDISWEVASETNNDYFVILKSYNGIAFASVDTIDGRGTVNGYKKYNTSYIEETQGTVYYKLKQVDFDGAFAYSEMITSSCGDDSRTFNVAPNPVKEGEAWHVAGLVPNDNLKVFDLYGREFEKDNLEKGVYMVVVNGKPVAKLIVY
jgi:hypothetical protein